MTTGIAFDYVHNLGGGTSDFTERRWNDDAVIGLYATYKATDKLSFNGRAEVIQGTEHFDEFGTQASYSSGSV